MSGLETLPPDQRAVLQLILAQGRGYAELASVLKIDQRAVRTRAHAGVEALAEAADAPPDPAERAQIADYLLGQQDEGERLVTLAQLGDSAIASRWAQALRERLSPLAREALPEVPEPLASNGAAAPPPVA
ncbi:MAG: sigma-70 region 4 domain-containing protein, partial [Conexibacter sp.]